jgi:hypothetical protein
VITNLARAARCGPRWVASIGALAAVLASGCSEDGRVAATLEADLQELERTRLEALVNADHEVLEELHADDFELVNSYGVQFSRSEYLRQIVSGQLDYSTWRAGQITVRLHNGLAVMRYRDLEFEAWFDGELASQGQLVHTNVYELREGSWQIVWSQASGGL